MDTNKKLKIDSSIGKVLKDYRNKNHLTQAQIAEKLEISEKYISRLENGKTGVKTETLVNYMNILGIAPNIVFEDLITNENIILQINLLRKIGNLSAEKIDFLYLFIDNLEKL